MTSAAATVFDAGAPIAFERGRRDAGTPAEVGLDAAEVVALRTEDGLELSAWFVSADDPVSTLLFTTRQRGQPCHAGEPGGGTSRTGRARSPGRLPGVRRQPGPAVRGGLVADARAAREHLLGRDDVDPDHVVYFGESIGSGQASALAVEGPPAAVVLRSPFTSLAHVGRLYYPFLPVHRLLRDRFPVADAVAHLAVPVLVVAGRR